MKEVYYIYNNEAIASCIFLAYLQNVKSIDMAQSCLILPFLLDDRTVMYFTNIRDDYDNSLEYIVNNSPKLFTSFNKRYLSLLPITINSILLLNKNKQIGISSNNILTKVDFIYDEVDMGNRFERIKKVIPFLASILNKYSTSQLYKILKVQL
jgi:hypothetical protein